MIGARIALALTARNEADIIEPMIRYHLAAGVECVFVAEGWSVDRTRQIIEQLAGETSRVVAVNWADKSEADSDHRDQQLAMTYIAGIAAERGFDWVLAADADEFWHHPQGLGWALGWAAAAGLNVVRFPVTEYAPDRSGRLDCVSNVWPDRRNWRGNIAHPKVAFRTHRGLRVSHGNREVVGMPHARTGEVMRAEILHVPWRDPAQMRAKAELRCTSIQPYAREVYLRPFRLLWRETQREFESMAIRGAQHGRLDPRLGDCLQLAAARVEQPA